MSKYFYKAEFQGVTYLRSSNGRYSIVFPKTRSLVSGITVTSSNASWSYTEYVEEAIAKEKYRIVLAAQEITEKEFRALSKIGRAQVNEKIAKERAEFDKALAEALAELKAEKEKGA